LFFSLLLCSLRSALDRAGGKEEKSIPVPLRHPERTVLLEGEWIHVVTEGAFVERDSRVTVVEVEGNRVVVEPL